MVSSSVTVPEAEICPRSAPLSPALMPVRVTTTFSEPLFTPSFSTGTLMNPSSKPSCSTPFATTTTPLMLTW